MLVPVAVSEELKQTHTQTDRNALYILEVVGGAIYSTAVTDVFAKCFSRKANFSSKITFAVSMKVRAHYSMLIKHKLQQRVNATASFDSTKLKVRYKKRQVKT